MNKKVSIVIPTYGHWELTHQLLLDILQYNKDVDEILILNDGSDDVELRNGIQWWSQELLPQIRLVNFEKNRGFLMTCNRGIEMSTGDIIILVSNDVRLQDDVVRLSRNLFANNPKLVVGGILYSTSTGWNEFSDGRKKIVFPYLEGWLLIFTRSAWDELDGFDEMYAPSDFEDVDFSTTAIEYGYTLSPLNNPKIRHLGGQTLGYENGRQERTMANKEKFRKKWIK